MTRLFAPLKSRDIKFRNRIFPSRYLAADDVPNDPDLWSNAHAEVFAPLAATIKQPAGIATEAKPSWAKKSRGVPGFFIAA